MNNLLLSILTPSVTSRREQLNKLCDELARQIADQPVEHCIFLDNCRRSVGAKRDSLLRIARGDFICFCDDDDWVREDYVEQILNAIESHPGVDVVTFRQHVVYNGQEGTVEFQLGNPNEKFKPGGVTKRFAWHVNCWKRSLAILSSFPDSSYGEDLVFSEKLNKLPNLRQFHIAKVLHEYHHSAETTLAPPPEMAIK